MMNNLFTMFDPSTNMFSLNWLALLIPMFFLPKLYFKKTNRTMFVITTINNTLIKDYNNNLKNKLKTSILILTSLFMMIYTMNILSIMPFIFAPTSHMVICLSWSLPIWLSSILIMWIKNTELSLEHMVPLNTPLILCPFMVIIETISTIIRPFTLAVRLMANMIAGHILISLLSSLILYSKLTMIPSSLVMNILIILELSVAMIQAYVFTILMSLYINEIY